MKDYIRKLGDTAEKQYKNVMLFQESVLNIMFHDVAKDGQYVCFYGDMRDHKGRSISELRYNKEDEHLRCYEQLKICHEMSEYNAYDFNKMIVAFMHNEYTIKTDKH